MDIRGRSRIQCFWDVPYEDCPILQPSDLLFMVCFRSRSTCASCSGFSAVEVSQGPWPHGKTVALNPKNLNSKAALQTEKGPQKKSKTPLVQPQVRSVDLATAATAVMVAAGILRLWRF